MMARRRSLRRVGAGALVTLTIWLAGAAFAEAQGERGTVRIALLPQWVVNQHRGSAGPGSRGPVVPAFRAALDRGVVDRVVFWWQRGVIQRESLVAKPIRVLGGPEAVALGARGEFQLVAVRPPSGPAAWTEVELLSQAGRPDDVGLLEIGGELNTINQVLETLLVAAPDEALAEVPLSPRALIPGPGVQVVRAPFGRPVAAGASTLFRGPVGIEFLVVRSPVEVTVNGGVSGFADVSPNPGAGTGDWREGDRVFVRVPLATLRAGALGIVLGWKDRELRPDPDGGEAPRRSSSLGFPFRP